MWLGDYGSGSAAAGVVTPPGPLREISCPSLRLGRFQTQHVPVNQCRVSALIR